MVGQVFAMSAIYTTFAEIYAKHRAYCLLYQLQK